jgi:predicted nucleotidyltransferase
MSGLRFPTALHRQVAELASDFFRSHELVDSVLVVNSCARGQAVPESDLDLAVLATRQAAPSDAQALEAAWQTFAEGQPEVLAFRHSGRFTGVHLDVFDGKFAPAVWDDGGGPDSFEVEIGNRIAYAAPLADPGARFLELQAHWLPYYDEELRLRRLAMVRAACAYDLDRVEFFLSRGLHFAAFDYHYKALQQFLQALFIARRAYPLSYTKWIREQVAIGLNLPELYRDLPALLSLRDLESEELGERAAALRRLLERWIPA